MQSTSPRTGNRAIVLVTPDSFFAVLRSVPAHTRFRVVQIMQTLRQRAITALGEGTVQPDQRAINEQWAAVNAAQLEVQLEQANYLRMNYERAMTGQRVGQPEISPREPKTKKSTKSGMSGRTGRGINLSSAPPRFDLSAAAAASKAAQASASRPQQGMAAAGGAGTVVHQTVPSSSAGIAGRALLPPFEPQQLAPVVRLPSMGSIFPRGPAAPAPAPPAPSVPTIERDDEPMDISDESGEYTSQQSTSGPTNSAGAQIEIRGTEVHVHLARCGGWAVVLHRQDGETVYISL